MVLAAAEAVGQLPHQAVGRLAVAVPPVAVFGWLDWRVCLHFWAMTSVLLALSVRQRALYSRYQQQLLRRSFYWPRPEYSLNLWVNLQGYV